AKIMSELEITSDMSKFDDLIDRLQASLSHHIKEEERDVLPRLERLSPDQIKSLGALIDSARKIAPTHPHPFSPHTPPGNMILGPVASLIDNVK
ncbi:hypothetical protein J4G37_63135, partial [Microvirga sp. 3-52]|nr:hypothetical protein [Microvirga sp. 3-52]